MDKKISNNNPGIHSDKQFGSKFGYLMVAAGAAVGLGNIWKFPYVAYGDGGGTFLILYIFVAIVLGIPGVLCEEAIGRHSRGDAVSSFEKINKKYKFIGWLHVASTCLIDWYYLIVSGYMIKYTVSYVREIFTGAAVGGADKAAYYDKFISDPVEPLIYGFLVIGITGLVLTFGITDKAEKICKIILPALFVMLIVCGFWALNISPGAKMGLKWYLHPNLSKINMRTFADACMQVLFSVGIGWGIFTTLGASQPGGTNIKSDSKWTVILDSLVAITAGFVVIPSVIGAGSKMTAGPSLVFLTMTSIFEKFPGGVYMGLFFFLALDFAIFSTTFTIVEIPIKVVRERFHFDPTKAVVATSLFLFAGGVFCSLSQGHGLLSGVMIPWLDAMGVHYFNIYDWVDCLSGYVGLPIGTLLCLLFVSRVWGYEHLNSELVKGGKGVTKWDKITIGYLAPICTLVVILHAFRVWEAIGLI